MSEALNLDAMTAANLLVWLKAECEAQHDRADQAEAEVERLRAVLGSRGAHKEPQLPWTAIHEAVERHIAYGQREPLLDELEQIAAALQGVGTPQEKEPQTPNCIGCRSTILVGYTIGHKPGPFCRTCWETLKQSVRVIDAAAAIQDKAHTALLPGTPHQEEKAAPK